LHAARTSVRRSLGTRCREWRERSRAGARNRSRLYRDRLESRREPKIPPATTRAEWKPARYATATYGGARSLHIGTRRAADPLHLRRRSGAALLLSGDVASRRLRDAQLPDANGRSRRDEGSSAPSLALYRVRRGEWHGQLERGEGTWLHASAVHPAGRERG